MSERPSFRMFHKLQSACMYFIGYQYIKWQSPVHASRLKKKMRRWMRSCMDEYYNSCYVQSVKGNRMNTKSVSKPFYLALYPSFLRPFATFVRFCFDWALHPTRTETRVNGLLEMIASRTTATYTRPDTNYFLLVLCRWMCLCCHSQTVWLKQTDTHSTPIVTIEFILYR